MRAESPVGIPGVCYRHDRVIESSPVALLRGFSKSGMQAWVDWRRYERDGDTWPIQTKRGCLLKCGYCAYPLVEAGHLAADADLAEGCFYLSPHLDEPALLTRIHQAVIANPSIVQAAESGASGAQALMYRTLHGLGVAPAYWRYLPELLRLPPLRFLRNRFPSVIAGSNRLEAWSAPATPL